MRGLLVRDWRYLRSQYFFLAIILGLTVLYMASDMMQFGECFAPLLLSFLTIRLTADELQPSRSRALFTLPFTRHTYVAERLVAGVAIPLALTVALAGVAMATGRQDLTASAVLCTAMACALAVMVSVFLPLTIRFHERGVVMLPVVLIAVGFVGVALGEHTRHALERVTAWVDAVPAWLLCGAGLAASALLLAGSACLSCRLLDRQDL